MIGWQASLKLLLKCFLQYSISTWIYLGPVFVLLMTHFHFCHARPDEILLITKVLISMEPHHKEEEEERVREIYASRGNFISIEIYASRTWLVRLYRLPNMMDEIGIALGFRDKLRFASRWKVPLKAIIRDGRLQNLTFNSRKYHAANAFPCFIPNFIHCFLIVK